MNKRQLLAAIKDYPDDAPVVVASDTDIRRLVEAGTYQEGHGGARIFSISSDPEVVRLEL